MGPTAATVHGEPGSASEGLGAKKGVNRVRGPLPTPNLQECEGSVVYKAKPDSVGKRNPRTQANTTETPERSWRGGGGGGGAGRDCGTARRLGTGIPEAQKPRGPDASAAVPSASRPLRSGRLSSGRLAMRYFSPRRREALYVISTERFRVVIIWPDSPALLFPLVFIFHGAFLLVTMPFCHSQSRLFLDIFGHF